MSTITVLKVLSNPPFSPQICRERSYDTEGNGEMMLGDLASAMGEVVGLTKEDVMPMFLQSGRMEEVSVTNRMYCCRLTIVWAQHFNSMG